MADTPPGHKRQSSRAGPKRRACLVALPATLLLVLLAALQARPRSQPAISRHVIRASPLRRIGDLPDLPGGALKPTSWGRKTYHMGP